MIPGLEGNKEFWRNQVGAFSARYRVVASGLLKRQPSSQSSVIVHAGDVVRLLDHLSLDRVALVGQSFGGMVAQEVAIHHPDRVAALVLCNTTDRPDRGRLGMNLFTLATFAHPLVFALPRSRHKPYLRWVGKHRGFVMDPSPGNDQLAEYVVEWGLRHGLGPNLERAVAGIRARTTERLSRIRSPTLVLRGSEDWIISPRTTGRLVERISGARLAVVEGGGHCCPYTMPGETNRRIMEFLDSVRY